MKTIDEVISHNQKKTKENLDGNREKEDFMKNQKENIIADEKEVNRFFGRPLKNSQGNNSNSVFFERGGKIQANNEKKTKVRRINILFL
jgi:hypothetical protein